jgi:hypothetical protein
MATTIFPANVKRGDAEGERMKLDIDQPGNPHPIGQGLGLGKAADALREVIVCRLGVSGQCLADTGQNVLEIPRIHGTQGPHGGRRKL